MAIARALAGEPDVLLLDEPMAGLDVAVAAAIRAVLRRVLARDGRSAMLVTHDLLDVVTLADQVLVLEEAGWPRPGPHGRRARRAPQRLRRPARRGQCGHRHRRVGRRPATPKGELWHGIRRRSVDAGQPAVAVFPPGRGGGLPRAPQGSPRNVLEVTVAEFDTRGTTIRVRADGSPTARRAWRPTSPPTPRRICGWRPVAGVVCHQGPGGRPAPAREPTRRSSAAQRWRGHDAPRVRHAVSHASSLRDGCRRLSTRGIVASNPQWGT